MSLYADYHRERLGWSVFEESEGFVAFSFAPPFCRIEDIYVRPESRKSTLAIDLMNRVQAEARSREDVTHLWSQVLVGVGDCERAVRANLGYGFKVIGAESGRIIFVKDIRGE